MLLQEMREAVYFTASEKGNMISCEEYSLLDEVLQSELLRIDGVFLMIRKTPRLSVHLFALYDFYVEAFFDSVEPQPLYLKSFEYGTPLHIYLEAIVIDTVFEKFHKSFLCPAIITGKPVLLPSS